MVHFAVLVFSLITLAGTAEAGKNWALLVAGSRTYWNYRHQADICHAYQVLHSTGMKDEQVVVMMYDDIAHNDDNPFPGTIVNRVGGPDVYQGVPMDYTRSDVNTDVFFAVLQGDKAKVTELTGKDNPKVIESGPHDNIFIFYADHGGHSVLSMPTGRVIKARELNDVLKKMHRNAQFSKMDFYLEAGESGSMFDVDLPSDINVYAVTATNGVEPDYACCYDYSRNAWVGDVFSEAWMLNTESTDIDYDTLDDQFHMILDSVLFSHPQRFGTLSLKGNTLSTFLAGYNSPSGHKVKDLLPGSSIMFPGMDIWPEALHKESSLKYDLKEALERNDTIRSELVPISILRRRLEKTPKDSHLRAKLERDLEQMETSLAQTYDFFWKIAKIVIGETPRGDDYKLTFTKGQAIENYACYDQAVDLLSDVCSKVDTNVNSLFVRNFYVMVNLCNHQPTEKVLYAVKSAAQFSPLCY